MAGSTTPRAANWLDIASLARIEVSSQEDVFPVEQAFSSTPTLGWRAGEPGTQLIRILFHQPQVLRVITLHFIERASERSQEIVLRCRQPGGESKEIRRQQFNFSPAGSTEEFEVIPVDLQDIVVVELEINPDRVNPAVHSDVYATLASMRLSPDPQTA